MSKKVLLINPEINGETLQGFPLGLAYLSSVLKNAGIEDVRAIDYNILESKLTEKDLINWKPDVIGISVMIPSFANARNKIEELHSLLPQSKIFVGGIAASVATEKVLGIKGVTGVYRGEGETIITDLVNNSQNDSWKSLEGISYLEKGIIVDNKLAPFLANLDEIPFPDRDLVSFENYLQDIHGSSMKAASIISSRGCPYNCVFCYRGPAAGKKFRYRSASNVVAEMDELHKKGVNSFMFWDDNFMLNKERVYQICDLIKDKGYEWKVQMRVDSVDEDILKTMREAGCVSSNIGIESGNNQILKEMKKGITKEKAEYAVELCKQNDIFVNAYFILGTPWDTLETMTETIEFAKRIDPHKAHFFTATPYPGTEMREVALQKGFKFDESWGNYRMKKISNPMIESPYYSAEEFNKLVKSANEYFRK